MIWRPLEVFQKPSGGLRFLGCGEVLFMGLRLTEIRGLLSADERAYFPGPHRSSLTWLTSKGQPT